ncbi:MAG: lytic murein transglycosylase B [Aquificaceae bacterium]|nr:MAG: lytic murein transglycosylase B [Aquificaceae bacterium]
MIKKKYLNVSSGLLFVALLGGCSANTVKQAETSVTPAPVVEPKPAKIVKKPTVKKLDKLFVNAEPAVQKRVVPKKIIRKKAPQRRYVAKRRLARKVAPQRRYIKPRPKARIAQYRPRPRVQRPRARVRPIARVYQPQVRRASLSGDFAGNPKAERFIDKMVSRYGFSRAYLNGILSNAQATNWMRKMAARDDHPIKRKKRRGGATWSRYRSHFLTAKHINAGVAFYRQNRATFDRAERQFGVPREIILGILGVETIYGGNVGKNRAIDALATMAFETTRRSRYFESELESYLLMARRSHINPLQPKASYAGALGLSQFMPSNVKRYGVDFDGDGSVNLWKPADAIGSIAKYFKAHGWRSGEMVAVPASNAGGGGYRTFRTGFKHTYSKSRLSRKGITARYQHNMRGKLSLIKLKTHSGDELWVGGKNFYVITRYNHSTHYAMAVHQLGQAVMQRVDPSYRRHSAPISQPSVAPRRNNRSISVDEAMELLSAENKVYDATIELRQLMGKTSIL